MAKEAILELEADINGSPEMPLKENRYSVEGSNRVHVKCMEESTKKAICAKKLKGLLDFFNAL